MQCVVNAQVPVELIFFLFLCHEVLLFSELKGQIIRHIINNGWKITETDSQSGLVG